MDRDTYIKENKSFFPNIEKVNKMSMEDKLSIYFKYHINQLCRKHNLSVTFSKYKTKTDINRERLDLEYPYKKISNSYFEFQNKQMKIVSFEDFTSKDNLIFNDFGLNHNYASRYRLDFGGIYNYVKQSEK